MRINKIKTKGNIPVWRVWMVVLGLKGLRIYDSNHSYMYTKFYLL